MSSIAGIHMITSSLPRKELEWRRERTFTDSSFTLVLLASHGHPAWLQVLAYHQVQSASLAACLQAHPNHLVPAYPQDLFACYDLLAWQPAYLLVLACHQPAFLQALLACWSAFHDCSAYLVQLACLHVLAFLQGQWSFDQVAGVSEGHSA
ncbi:hypothetical protein E2C01_021193 [Portunus trituberculatus]|uniref:Uncharacterized protein n=1 Tax=Portunus trituberculatus TaxID=210409 RepID=A0A5B7E221_PORTR|nr:hypothetical protein [Portunus trituberculatus]